MEAVLFSPAQMHLVTLMSHIKSEDALDQLKDQLADFYARQVDEEMEELWESGEWNEQKLQSLQDAHFRTPYK
jgi:capsule polysaccharide export protein KpsE/RkpR